MVGTRWALPDITFTNRITIHWGDQETVIEHHPGAAPGGTWVVLPAARVIFAGDAVLPDQPLFLTHADIPAWIETLDLFKSAYKNYVVIGGRTGPVPIDLIIKQQQHLKHILKGIERLAKRNAPVDAVESLIPGILEDLSFPPDLTDTYYQRYRHGLSQYYARRYRPSELVAE
jgi:glyoxylase-like metal-dependent hydrolase (beta-lactamase superfamily II)